MMKYFWGAVIVLHPYIMKISQITDNRQGIDFAFCCFVVMSCMAWGIKTDFKLGVFLSIPILLNLVNQNDFNTYFALSQNFNYIIGSLFLVHIFTHIEKLEETFHKSVVVASIIGGVYLLLSLCDFNPRAFIINTFYEGVKVKKIFGGQGGFLMNPNVSGAFFAFAIPSYLKLNLKEAVLYPVFMAGVTSAWPICTMLAFGVYFLLINRKFSIYPYIAAIIAISISFFAIDPTTMNVDSGRFLTWLRSFHLFIDSQWFLGNGLGWFAENFPKTPKPFGLLMRQEHNEFLAALYAFGPIGLGMLLMAFNKLRKTPNNITAAAIFCIFVNMICNFPLHVSSLFIMCGFWAAIAYKEVINHDAKMERKSISR